MPVTPVGMSYCMSLEKVVGFLFNTSRIATCCLLHTEYRVRVHQILQNNTIIVCYNQFVRH